MLVNDNKLVLVGVFERLFFEINKKNWLYQVFILYHGNNTHNTHNSNVSLIIFRDLKRSRILV